MKKSLITQTIILLFLVSIFIFHSSNLNASKLSDFYQEQADQRIAAVCFWPYQNLPEARRASFAIDDFTGELKMIYGYQIIKAEAYIGGNDPELNQWMQKWFNISKMYYQGLSIVFSNPQMPLRLVQGEINNFLGVKNPLLISYQLSIIQSWGGLEHQILNDLLAELAHNEVRYEGKYREAYRTNPANYLLRAGIYNVKVLSEQDLQRQEDYIFLAISNIAKANEMYLNQNTPFYYLFEQLYDQAQQEQFHRQYLIALALTLFPTDLIANYSSLLPQERLNNLGKLHFMPILETILHENPEFPLADLPLSFHFLQSLGLKAN